MQVITVMPIVTFKWRKSQKRRRIILNYTLFVLSLESVMVHGKAMRSIFVIGLIGETERGALILMNHFKVCLKAFRVKIV